MPSLGLITLTENGILLSAATENQILLPFGTNLEVILEALDVAFLIESEDTGLYENALCEPSLTRKLSFDGLELVFSNYDFGPVFTQWFVSGLDAKETDFRTLDRIGMGSTVKDLQEIPNSEVSITQVTVGSNDPAGIFIIDPFGLGLFIEGLVGNMDADGKVLQMWAGDSCKRIFVG